MQGSARRDTSALASALALAARTFILCSCCENRDTLSRDTEEGRVTQRPKRPPADPLLRRDFSCLNLRVLSALLAKVGCLQAHGTRKVARMCRAAQPARGAGGSVADPGGARSRAPRRLLFVQTRSKLIDVPEPCPSTTDQSTQAWVPTVRESPQVREPALGSSRARALAPTRPVSPR
jgi:hypothetical protein